MQSLGSVSNNKNLFTVFKKDFLKSLQQDKKIPNNKDLEEVNPQDLSKTKGKILNLIKKYEKDSKNDLNSFKKELNDIKKDITPSKYSPLRLLNRHQYSLNKIDDISTKIDEKLNKIKDISINTEDTPIKIEDIPIKIEDTSNKVNKQLTSQKEKIDETTRVDEELSNAKKPHNYNKIKIPGLNISVSGMAHPVAYSRGKKLDDILSTLKNDCKIDVMISLDHRNKETIEKQWTSDLTKSYYNFEVIDFTPPSTDQMKMVADIIDKSNDEGKNVIIHCGEGLGRTGTMLASLVLRSLIINESKNNPAYFSEDQTNKKETLRMPSEYFSGPEPKATPLVSKAIEEVRFTYGAHSVETADQVKELEKYEQILREELNPNKTSLT